MFGMGGCAEKVLVCVCGFDIEVCGDAVVFVKYDCNV